MLVRRPVRRIGTHLVLAGASKFAPVVRTWFATTIAREPHRAPTFHDQVVKHESAGAIPLSKAMVGG